MLKRLLWGITVLSLIPAMFLVIRRGQSEHRQLMVSIVMDEQALAEQANLLGTTSFNLALRYQKLGLNGIALYEDTVESLVLKGRVGIMLGHEVKLLDVGNNTLSTEISPNSTLLTEIEPGSLSNLLLQNYPKPLELQIDQRTWYVYPGNDMMSRPAGYNLSEINRWSEANFDIAYRPRNFPNLTVEQSGFPEKAKYLIYVTGVVGHPNHLEKTVLASQNYLTAIIEGTEQPGMNTIFSKVPIVRLLSFNQEYLNRRLLPDQVVAKYLLAANERGVKLLYLRPYTEGHFGDMVENTESLIGNLRQSVENDGFQVGTLSANVIKYNPVEWLRTLAGIGVLASLVLLALLYPGIWGPTISLTVLGAGIAIGGLDWGALALIAALTFPVLGYTYIRDHLTSVGLATLVSLSGVVLMVAVGSDHDAMLAVKPFAGVGATLIVPPLLFIFHYALRFKPAAGWVKTIWTYQPRVGDLIVFTLAIIALMVVYLRRGNFPLIGVSNFEVSVRDSLSGLFVRPRFKEIIGHPLAVLGLTNKGWSIWVRGGLMTGGVIAQASILNSFSHYHTPLLISLQRSILALVLGIALGLALTPIIKLLARLISFWLRDAEPEAQC
ncbi:MAG: DUF5693 family protein [Deinococcales bacterium]|nr:DUF5693 family protein [Deinococcales bacterium]